MGSRLSRPACKEALSESLLSGQTGNLAHTSSFRQQIAIRFAPFSAHHF